MVPSPIATVAYETRKGITRSIGPTRATASRVIASRWRPTNGTQQTVRNRCRLERSRLRIVPSKIALRKAWPVSNAAASTKKAVNAAARDVSQSS